MYNNLWINLIVIRENLSKSGFDRTIAAGPSGPAPVYDGENIFYYFRDLSKMDFWKDCNPRRGDWNASIKKTFEESEYFKEEYKHCALRKNNPSKGLNKADKILEEDVARKFESCFPPKDKVLHLKSKNKLFKDTL